MLSDSRTSQADSASNATSQQFETGSYMDPVMGGPPLAPDYSPRLGLHQSPTDRSQEMRPLAPPPLLGDSREKPKEGTREALLVLFEEYADDHGFINGEDALEILQESGIGCDKETLKSLLPNWNAIELDVFLDAVEQLRTGGEAKAAAATNAAVAVTVEYLGFPSWLLYKLNPCKKAHPGIEYRLRRIDLSVSPRTQLIGTTAFTLFVVGLCIILLMFMLWTQFGSSAERRHVNNFNTLLSSFIERFDVSSTVRHASEMRDGAEITASILEQQLNARQNASLAGRLGNLSVGIATVADGFASEMRMLSELRSRGSAKVLRSVLEHLKPGRVLGSSIAQTLLPNTTVYLNSNPVVPHPRTNDTAAAVCHSKTAPIVGDVVVLRLDVNASVTLCVVGEAVPTATVFSEVSSRLAAVSSIGDLTVTPLPANFSIPQLPGDTGALINGCQAAIPDCEQYLGYIESVYRSNSRLETELVFVGRQSLQLAAARASSEGICVLMSISNDDFLNGIRNETIETANYLNFQFVRSTEIVVSQRDENGAIEVQATKFRFFDGCYSHCERRPYSALNVLEAFRTKRSGFAPTPDYRPEPVMGAYAYVRGLEIVYLIERDILEINGITLNSLRDTYNDLNKEFQGSLEVQLVHRDGYPPMHLFSPQDDCSDVEDCFSVDPFGVVFRSDCLYCQRQTVTATMPTVAYLTEFRFNPTCRPGSDDFLSCTNRVDSISEESLLRRGEVEAREGTDYRGANVIAAGSFLTNLSTATVVKVDVEEGESEVSSVILISVVTSVAFLFGGLIALFFLTRRAMVSIEKDWARFRRQTTEEKAAYNTMVRGYIPTFLAWKSLRGENHVGQNMPLFIAGVEIPTFSQVTTGWDAQEISMFVAYFSTLQMSVADYFGVNRINALGDLTLYAAGFNVDDNGDEEVVAHPEVGIAMLEFATTLIQLCHPQLAHYPQKVTHIAKHYGAAASKKLPQVPGRSEHVGCVVMPDMTVAMHFCQANVVIRYGIDGGKSVDVLGNGGAVVSKVLSMTMLRCASLTEAAVEQCAQHPDIEQFELSRIRRTMVRGRGKIEYRFVEHMDTEIPPQLMEDFGIKYARRRIVYGEKRLDDDGMSEGGASAATYDQL